MAEQSEVERLARYLCTKAGHDPDWQVIPEIGFLIATPKGRMRSVDPTISHALWTDWIETARAALDYRAPNDAPRASLPYLVSLEGRAAPKLRVP